VYFFPPNATKLCDFYRPIQERGGNGAQTPLWHV